MVALSGTLAVAAWNAPVDYQRFNLAVMTISLGPGHHPGVEPRRRPPRHRPAELPHPGRRRRNRASLVLVYSSFVRSNGSQIARTADRRCRDLDAHSTSTACPGRSRCSSGFPALIVGVSLRSRAPRGLVGPGVCGDRHGCAHDVARHTRSVPDVHRLFDALLGDSRPGRRARHSPSRHEGTVGAGGPSDRGGRTSGTTSLRSTQVVRQFIPAQHLGVATQEGCRSGRSEAP